MGQIKSLEEAFAIPFNLDLPQYKDTQPYKPFIVFNAWNIISEGLVVSWTSLKSVLSEHNFQSQGPSGAALTDKLLSASLAPTAAKTKMTKTAAAPSYPNSIYQRPRYGYNTHHYTGHHGGWGTNFWFGK